MNRLFWNIRGIRKGEKSVSIRKIVEKRKVSFMGLVETKHKVVAINKPILLMGDFNVVLNSRERIESFRCDLSMREFSDWIEALGLIDIPLHGVKFTLRRNESKSRLDRGLCCQAWLRMFLN